LPEKANPVKLFINQTKPEKMMEAIVYVLALVGVAAIVALPFVLSMISSMASRLDSYERADDEMDEAEVEEFQNCLNEYAADVIENAVAEAKVRKGATQDKLLEVANRHRTGELVIVMNTDNLFDDLHIPDETADTPAIPKTIKE